MSLLLCYIFLLHQTTTLMKNHRSALCCVISFFYIKPQRKAWEVDYRGVVLYLSSTSNHNQSFPLNFSDLVVLYLSSTSNHNPSVVMIEKNGLCYIFLLHQTTTLGCQNLGGLLLCYIFLLHQTTTRGQSARHYSSCVISFFYIKPQHSCTNQFYECGCVISFFYIKPQPLHRTNCRTFWLCYIFLLHQTTTLAIHHVMPNSCVISFFYIKPQLI